MNSRIDSENLLDIGNMIHQSVGGVGDGHEWFERSGSCLPVCGSTLPCCFLHHQSCCQSNFAQSTVSRERVDAHGPKCASRVLACWIHCGSCLLPGLGWGDFGSFWCIAPTVWIVYCQGPSLQVLTKAYYFRHHQSQCCLYFIAFTNAKCGSMGPFEGPRFLKETF